MPPKKPPKPPPTPEEKENARKEKNEAQRARYANKSQAEKEETQLQAKERRDFLKSQRTPAEKDAIATERAAKRKVARQQQTDEQKEKRRKADAERHAEVRMRESEEQRVGRQNRQRVYAELVRRLETEEERADRLNKIRTYTKQVRREESKKEKANRLDGQRMYEEFVRSEETVHQREQRVLSDRLRHQERITEETEEEATTRRELNAEQNASWRAVENEEETEERRREDRDRHAREREQERLLNEHLEEMQRSTEKTNRAEIVPIITREEYNLLVDRLSLAKTHFHARNENVDESTVEKHSCGSMNENCEECDAKHFKKERPPDKKFTTCCNKGKVILPPPKTCPVLLHNHLTNVDKRASNFMKCIRNYNSALAFASMGATISLPPGKVPYCFRIHGQVYYNTSAVTINHHVEKPSYAQLYFIEPEQADEARGRNQANVACDRNLMRLLDVDLRRINPYGKLYKTCRTVLEEEYAAAEREGRPHYAVGMVIHGDRRTHDQRRDNSPTTNEIGVVFKSTDGAPPANRDVCARLLIPTNRNTAFIKIKSTQPMCDPMTYPLLFPNGDNGWHYSLPYSTTTRADRDRLQAADHEDVDMEEEDLVFVFVEPPIREDPNRGEEEVGGEQAEAPEREPEEDDDNDPDVPNATRTREKRQKISQLEFYSSLLHVRHNQFNNVLAGGMLTQQYMVDSYVKIES